MITAAPVLAVRRPWFWILFAVISAACGALAWRMFPVAFPVLSLDIRMDRAGAIRAARQLAAENKWGPGNAARDAASFGVNSQAQAFVELEGGGKKVFASLLREGLYAPYSWQVRLFREGETNQTTVRFRPDGGPYGFVETLRERAPGASLAGEPAREIAERAARGGPWRLALERFNLVESSHVARPGGRVDHTFVYERPDRQLGGEGRLRLRLVVGGDRLIELTHFIKIPEGFTRRYEQMRSTNNAIAGGASGAMLLLYGIGGCGVGMFVLLRSRAVLWRPALACAGLFAVLQLLAGYNAWPLAWLNYDTALSGSGFILEQQVRLITGSLAMGVVFFLSFVAAEGLTRRAFPGHPQFWRLWSATAGAATPVLGRTLAGYLFAPLSLLYVLVFYFFAARWLGWWTPMEALVEPNLLAHFWPWLTPLTRAMQAGFWEEMLFRAVPIAGAALLGERFGGRRWWIGAALVVQAVIFAGAHANYPGQPGYSRLVELIIPSLIFGGLYLRLGLLPAIVLHFTYDIVLMALPLFASTAPGIWLDRGAVVLLSLLPLWFVQWRRWRAGASAELPAGFWNRDWAPAPAPPTEPSRPPWAAAAGEVEPWLWRGTLAVAVLGAAGWIANARVTRLGPPLTIGRGEAERIARVALSTRGVTLPAGARALVTVTVRPADSDRFVWEKVGSKVYEALLGAYVPVPRWVVRFATFEGDVAERAEEWICYVYGDGSVQRVRHHLPEARAAATLSKDEARASAHAVLRDRYGRDPATLTEVSATSAKRPKRMDWTFVFKDPEVSAIAPGEGRISVSLAGDEVTDSSRFVFLPEDWERAQRKLAGSFRTGGVIRTTFIAVLLLAGTAVAVVALSRGRFALRMGLAIAGMLFTATILITLNRWPAVVAGFSTTRSYDLQRVTAAVAPLVGGLVMAAVFALVAGAAARWLRPPIAGLRRAAGFGCTLGWIAIGALTIAGAVRGRASPPWPSFAGAETFVPWVSASLGAMTRYLAETAVLLLFFGAIDRWSAGWTRRRVVVGALAVVAGAVLTLSNSAPDLASWLGSGVLLGVAVLVFYAFALRHDLSVLPLVTGVMSMTGVMEAALQRQYPTALPGAILAVVAVGALAWWWFKALRAVATPAATADTASDVAAGAAPGAGTATPGEVALPSVVEPPRAEGAPGS
ncbi:MAG: CPBP family intramembrane metalloprotease [Verrucomicrobia bacterium]|nr:CPBP family intramembrane metalloprotease [Verrucomicrobiota bacterium]